MTFPIDRRRFVGLLGLGAAAQFTTIGARPARAAERITVLNWQGYGTDEKWAVAEFTKSTGIEVVHDYFSSEPEMITKVRTNPGAYDVVLCNSARVSQVQAENLLAPIDFSKIPNAAGLAPKLRESPSLVLDGKTYGVSWVWGMTALAARTGKGALPDSWAALSDPANKGRVALADDSTAMIGIGALLTGQDINAPKDFDSIKATLRAMKPDVKLLWSSEDQWNKAFTANEFDVAPYWSGGAVRSIRRYKLPLAYIVPKEGAIGWLDSLTVPASSTKKDAALQFINYMIDPGFYVQWVEKAGAPASAYAAAMDKLPADDLNRVTYKADYLPHLQFQAPLSDDIRQKINDLWEETKAFYAQ
jgi:spermidine/putrescine transport system substrate-binding protein